MGRRARTPFTLYWRKECGCWWVQFVVKGTRHRESTASADWGEAESGAAAIWQEAKARAGEPAVPGSVTRPLSGLADDLLSRVSGHGRAATYVRDLEVDLRLHILPRWPTAEAVTSLSWEEAREELHEAMSWSSVKRVGKHLRLLLRYAKDHGAIRSVPEIKSPPRELIAAEATELEPFTRKERETFLLDLRARGNLRALRCYEVMFFNLFRKSTVQRLELAWVNWQKHTVRVPPSKAKNSEQGVYWMHPRTEAALRAAVKDPKVYGYQGKKKEHAGRIFGHFDHSNVFWSACKRLGLVRTNAKGEVDRRGLTAHHVARRTSATLLVDAGVSTKDRMAAGGWKSIEAAERYDLGEQVERSKRALRKLR